MPSGVRSVSLREALKDRISTFARDANARVGNYGPQHDSRIALLIEKDLNVDGSFFGELDCVFEQIGEDLKDAMRAKDTNALMVLRALKSAIKYAAIEKGGADAELVDLNAGHKLLDDGAKMAIGVHLQGLDEGIADHRDPRACRPRELVVGIAVPAVFLLAGRNTGIYIGFAERIGVD